MGKHLIEGSDIITRVIPFPTNHVDGYMLPNEDGSINIYINANVSESRRYEAYWHEIKHIRRDDLHNDTTPVRELEVSL